MKERNKEHSNLYYIFWADQKVHPPPGGMKETLEKNILENFQKLKTL